tara:strand:- start:525 stop:626 length:102 start_codon:yes stop_codon:yes gene_type:complete
LALPDEKEEEEESSLSRSNSEHSVSKKDDGTYF